MSGDCQPSPTRGKRVWSTSTRPRLMLERMRAATPGGTSMVREATPVSVRTSVTQALKRVDFANEKNGWIVGFNGTVLTTRDAGTTWNVLGIETKQRLFGLFIDRNYGYAVGENGLFAQYSP